MPKALIYGIVVAGVIALALGFWFGSQRQDDPVRAIETGRAHERRSSAPTTPSPGEATDATPTATGPTPTSPADIARTMVWDPSDDVQLRLLETCAPSAHACIVSTLRSSGAPEGAIDAYRRFGRIPYEVIEIGPVAYAPSWAPAVQPSVSGVVFGAEGGHVVDHAFSQTTFIGVAGWRELETRYGDVSKAPYGARMDRPTTRPDGGIGLHFSFDLVAGCSACGIPFSGTIAYVFDGDGTLLETRNEGLCNLSSEEAIDEIAACRPPFTGSPEDAVTALVRMSHSDLVAEQFAPPEVVSMAAPLPPIGTAPLCEPAGVGSWSCSYQAEGADLVLDVAQVGRWSYVIEGGDLFHGE